jgi:hypothetical protein
MELDGLFAGYMGLVDKAISLIPYKKAATWKEFMFNPTDTIKRCDETVAGRLVSLYVMNAIGLVIALISMLPIIALTFMGNALAGGFVMTVIAIGVAAGFILGPILNMLYSVLEYLVAKLVGGTGRFQAHFNASALPGLGASIILLPLTVAEIPFTWLRSIPIIGVVSGCLTVPFSVVFGLVALYSLYPKYLAFKEVHKVSDLRALAIIFVPVFIIMALLVAIMVMFYAAIMAAIVSGSLATGAIK